VTDRVNALTVVLEQDVRVDDVEGLILAISRFVGVASVTANVADLDSHIAAKRARFVLEGRILDLLRSL
jgi:hypothetical protein